MYLAHRGHLFLISFTTSMSAKQPCLGVTYVTELHALTRSQDTPPMKNPTAKGFL